ncbi:MAG: hypothetical protein IJ763_01370 [Lachnospiraceae bacterium]|nr:hypothetical protein [Lachnospiraceae bacterium]
MSKETKDNEINVDIDAEDSDVDIDSRDSDVKTEDIEEAGDDIASEDNIDSVQDIEAVEDIEEEDNVKKQITRDVILEHIYDEDNGYKKNDVIKEDKEKTPFKALGIFSLIIALAGLALIGVLVYFVILNPYYIKSGASDKPLYYPELITGFDSQDKSELLESYQATETDAETDTEE